MKQHTPLVETTRQRVPAARVAARLALALMSLAAVGAARAAGPGAAPGAGSAVGTGVGPGIGSVTGPGGGPGVGTYEARLCVATAAQPPSCGPAEAEWRAGGWARVRVSDIAYQLQLRDSQVDVTTWHGAMEIDGFTANVARTGRTLRFTDPDKNVNYEVTWGQRKAANR